MWLKFWEEYLFHVFAVVLAAFGIVLAVAGAPLFSEKDGGLGWWICFAPLYAIIATSLHVRASRKRDEKLRQAR